MDLHPLQKLISKREKTIIGLMSGTSLDGIDAALVKVLNSGKETEIELLNFHTFPYPDQLREQLLHVSHPKQGTVSEICWLNFLLGEFYSDAVIDICKRTPWDISQIDLIGSHGQTIHHLPNPKKSYGKEIRSTLQIGELSVIANRTGVVTVGNFRSADLAVKGQGAPLVPYFDFLMFASDVYNRVILNIGGIANVTVLPVNASPEKVVAYDTGPGNMVIDALMTRLFHKKYDESGLVADRGVVCEPLLSALLEHPFFDRPAPKSTGREEFGNDFVERVLKLSAKLKVDRENIIATVTELTVRAVIDGLKFSPLPAEDVDQMIVSGGGLHNKAIMKSLKAGFKNGEVLASDQLGIPADAKEAICFAVLANETIAGNPANLPSVTGASRPAILGTISFA